jgi:hypothetical protein
MGANAPIAYFGRKPDGAGRDLNLMMASCVYQTIFYAAVYFRRQLWYSE